MNWFVAQCTLKGYWMVIVAPSVGLLLLIIIWCGCRCCLCKSDIDDGEGQYLISKREFEKEKRKQYFFGRSEKSERIGVNENKHRTSYGLYNKL